MSKPTVVFDFDGVIHSYASGWQGATVIPDPPVHGIKEAIDEIRKDYEVVVVSTRCASPDGLAAVCEYLVRNGIEVDKVQMEKPPAICYVDDRAICFSGNPAGLPELIRNFHSWTEFGPDALKHLHPLEPAVRNSLVSGTWPGHIKVRGREKDINAVLQSIKEDFPYQNFDEIKSGVCCYVMGGVTVELRIIKDPVEEEKG